ncbi:phosphodiester glycosidase family protein [Candidatus Parabeggiatoa sp. HSG14]|uniref:phosphodiester glycosidase family protein n=1 Tax=Candidatus Parabeggiatoa sp. HSG14 TaxID=3055593 RepID=UPI0025A6DCC1|nr:phosphodiester glycosidase family protein [Thiotrichales bacterium HSG14]
MRKFAFILFVICFALNVEAEIYDEDGVVIIEFDNKFEYLYFPTRPPTVSDVGKLYGYKYIINGSFFDGWRGNSKHAGWLKIFGQIHSQIKKDKQLTHIVIVNANGKLEFVDYHDFIASEKSQQTIEFQTGPLILYKNKVTMRYINSSINGNGKYSRSLIGFTSDGKKYFIVTKVPFSLSELANILLKNSVFQGKELSVMNLDGGPSVALYVKDNPTLSINVNGKLPLLLAVE